ncbi:hypothetical protein [Allomesorhizobium camelthorni]|uniref:DUF4760 domain-containing protein n=1 Tax=Allomesorhizobium camelthorni TaxID=475069 RepID=A0A6G4W8Q6_9HYPH|nr:hypothetical protein [Mesorhizobium camelthorni]NGO50944.1 hypothetical protein [Mesorhizobium camelthorni]
MPETFAAMVSVVIATIALFLALYQWRVSQLRKEEVQHWANEAIAALRKICLYTGNKDGIFEESFVLNQMSDLCVTTSTLVERGRLYFKNKVIDDFNKNKFEAYRGYRPDILDQIMIAHNISCAWRDSDADTRKKLSKLSEYAARKFVSLVQKEIGRDRTASKYTQTEGQGADIRYFLHKLDQVGDLESSEQELIGKRLSPR